MRRRNGQSLVESTIVLMLFLAMVLGVIDVSQVLFAHQSLMNRVSTALRYGTLHPGLGAEAVRNYVLYGQPAEPSAATAGYLGLKPENVVVQFPAPEADPDDALLTVSIVNFESHLYSPWIARVLVNPRPVIASAPLIPQALPSASAN